MTVRSEESRRFPLARQLSEAEWKNLGTCVIGEGADGD
jgi:hypothetical protein